MLSRNFKLSLVSLALLSVAFLIPSLFIPLINFGQLDKQTFVAELIRGFMSDQVVQGLFPIRHFVECYHSDLVPWAEEFPLYHFVVTALMHLFHGMHLNSVNPIIVGKALSLLALFTLCLGFFNIGKRLSNGATPFTPWIFAAVGILFPVFRLYSTQVMPDLLMTAFCVLAIERTLSTKPKTAALFIAIATLLKYYAAFTGIGIGLYHLYEWYRTKRQGPFWNASTLALAVLPCVLFIVYFVHLEIPNPITEYRNLDGHGHLSSLQGILEPKKWARVALWLFVKNSTLLGSALAGLGLYRMRKNIHPLLITLLVGWALFPLTFIGSFYVHDYYGLQGSIGTAIFAAFGVTILCKSKKSILTMMSIFAVWSIIHVRSMTRPNLDFAQIQNDYPSLIQALPKNPRWVFTLSGISKPVIPFILNLNSWGSAFEELDHPITRERMKDDRIELLFIHNFLTANTDTEKAIRIVNETHRFELISDRSYTQTRFLVFKRI